MNYAVIAAGEGSRLGNEGVSCPKPMVKLDGVPLIGRLINTFMDCKAEEIRIVINSHSGATAEYLQGLKDGGMPLEIAVADTPSSLHSLVALGLDDAGGKWCVTTVDTIFNTETFARYIDAWQQSGADALMAVTPYIDDEKPLYVAVDADGKIRSFSDTPTPGPQYVSGGIYCLSATALRLARQCVEEGESRMRNYQRALLRHDLRADAFIFDKIIDVDHASDIAAAEAMVRHLK